MKKQNLQLSMLSFLVLFLSCSNDDTFRGSGNIITESRDVQNFTKIYNPTSVNIIVVEGPSQNVELSADDNVINSIKTTVENETLKIDLTKGNYKDVTISVNIVIPTLNGLENSGSGNMSVSGFEDFASLEIDNMGSGNVTLNGSGTSLTLKNSGSGNYKGFGFIVSNCTVTNAGSGSCEINCSDTLSGSNSGSGSVFYKGNAMVDVSNTGSGKVESSN
ncbi:MAG: DUF2807 domain-containing protein [Maribacter sp.]